MCFLFNLVDIIQLSHIFPFFFSGRKLGLKLKNDFFWSMLFIIYSFIYHVLSSTVLDAGELEMKWLALELWPIGREKQL